jgi:hypothetical protein
MNGNVRSKRHRGDTGESGVTVEPSNPSRTDRPSVPLPPRPRRGAEVGALSEERDSLRVTAPAPPAASRVDGRPNGSLLYPVRRRLV